MFNFKRFRNWRRVFTDCSNVKRRILRTEVEVGFFVIDEFDGIWNCVYTELWNKNGCFMSCRFEYDSKNREVYREWNDGSYIETKYNVFGRRKDKWFASGGKYFKNKISEAGFGLS